MRKSRKQPELRLRTAASTLCPSRGALAQLVRAPPCHGGGCGFEPRRLRTIVEKARPISWARTFGMLMINSTVMFNSRHAVDRTLAAMEEMERYCAAHPGSPTAIRRPRLSIRGRTFVALLGPAIEEGIAGFGDSVSAALRAFDAQYSRSLRPPSDLE